MGAKGAMVTVYKFKVWDPTRNEYVVQPCKSTDKRIRTLDGIMFGHTGEEVDPASLDAEGLYWPPGLRALFRALAAWSLYALLRRQWLTAGALCLLAGASRAAGAVLVAVVMVAAVIALVRRRDGALDREFHAAFPVITGQIAQRAPFLAVTNRMGLVQGQNWALDALAADCADDGQYDFLLCATPLPITHGFGGPVAPTAVK